MMPKVDESSNAEKPSESEAKDAPDNNDSLALLRMFDSKKDWIDFQRVFSQFSGMTILSLDAKRTLHWMQAAFEEMGRQNIRSYTMADVMIDCARRIEVLEAKLKDKGETV